MTQIPDQDSSYINFLTGLRGSFALWVILHHSTDYFGFKGDYRIAVPLGLSIGVYGFFMLSAFLLTHRLYNEFKKSDGSRKRLLLITIKYFIRRFYRIYVPFFILSTLIWLDPTHFRGWAAFASWKSMVTLQSSGVNFLWTIAPEIKYYFFIPLFTLCMYMTGKYSRHCILILSFVTIIIDFFSLIERDNKDMGNLAMGYRLSLRFTIFFRGSLLGILYNDIAPDSQVLNTKIIASFKEKYVGYILLILYLYGIRLGSIHIYPKILHDMIHYTNFFSYYYFIIFALMLYSNPNFFNNFFQKNFFIDFGKYSYGVYLLHQAIFVQVKQKLPPLKTHIEQFMLVLFFVYLGGWIFYKFLETPLVKLAHKTCSYISSMSFFQASPAVKLTSDINDDKTGV